jgi:hypothetical protein
MMKVIQVAEGAFFVPSYSEQTIMRAYTIDATVQSCGLDDWIGEYGLKKENKHQQLEVKVDLPGQLARG